VQVTQRSSRRRLTRVAVGLAETTRPDVVLMDVRMPVMDGLEAARQILALDGAGTIRVLMLTTFVLDEYVFGALKAGASGFLLKDTRRRTCWPASRPWRPGRRCSRPA
jgi:DNA-binding NarL/FixJ family response regulator